LPSRNAGAAGPAGTDPIESAARRVGIYAVQAALAVSAVLRHPAARLPSPLVGRMREQLDDGAKRRVSAPAGAQSTT
jgi:hypothetical protein